MEISRHYYTDKYGYDCAVEMLCEDGIVVFDSIPKLSFDYKKHGLSIRRVKGLMSYDHNNSHGDYVLSFTIKDGQLYFRSFLARPSFFYKNDKLFGVNPETYCDEDLSIYRLCDIPVEYSGTLIIGKDFDNRHWPTDDRSKPMPFSPEVFKKNGYIRFEQGKAVDCFLENRKNDE